MFYLLLQTLKVFIDNHKNYYFRKLTIVILLEKIVLLKIFKAKSPVDMAINRNYIFLTMDLLDFLKQFFNRL